jgi:hypothetical protein
MHRHVPRTVAGGDGVGLQLLPGVAFDHAAAARAAQECRDAAARLQLTQDRRATALDHARQGWEGAARSDADSVAAALDTAADGLRQRLLTTAAMIERAMDDAEAEQRRRDRVNDERREEHRREQERRAAALDAGNTPVSGPR